MGWRYYVTHVDEEGEVGDEVSAGLESNAAEELIESLSDENDYVIVGVLEDD